MSIRKKVFFLLDSMTGGAVKTHMEDITKCRDDIQGKRQKEYLDAILQYASSEIPFYEHIDPSSIKNFPVMDKSAYNRNRERVMKPGLDLSKLHYTSTSGSSGVPFRTYQDGGKRKRNRADLMALLSEYGFEIGEKYVFIRSWVSLYGLSKIKMLKQNFVAVDVNTFDDSNKEKLRKLLHSDKKIKAIISYGSALEDFVGYLEEKKDDLSDTNLKLISSSADALSDSVKNRLEKMFGCPVVNRYSNEECGIMGHTRQGTTKFTLNTASYYFELLNLEEDTPVKAGEVGRIVVTDLFNHAMPLIRYDTSDLGISDEDGGCIRSLTSLEGRMDDVLVNSKGVIISAVTLSSYMQQFDQIERYQLIQNKDGSLEMLVVSQEENFDELLQTLKEIFGEGVEISVRKVASIDKEKTGKYKEIKVKK